ncbi:MAG: type II toxin-antitoxin system HicA family toxin [Planctomycetes bacterium]|nr:type II toxin-antitoxin system HicA family toxin [Planctomycetota bacterium]
MGERLPAVKDRDLVRVLKKIGFEFFRAGKGSHEIYRRASDGRHAVIPRHAGQDLKRRTLTSILTDAGLSIEDLRRLLKS